MLGRVFISCGQKNQEEIRVAKDMVSWLKKVGYSPYVAISTQTIEDVNSGIIDNLKKSDYYIFIDFPREKVEIVNGLHRGSLFTHQELALAYLLKFERVLFLKHKKNKLEGLLRYIGSNSILFDDNSNIVEIVQHEFNKRRWKANYTRHLVPKNLRWNNPVLYRDHVGNEYSCRALTIDLLNQRVDTGAYNTVAKLKFIEDKEGKNPCGDRSFLKVTGQPGFSQFIWPQDHGAFDLMLLNIKQPSEIYLNSALDLRNKPPIINTKGIYTLYYVVISENMPMVEFQVNLNVTGDINNTPVQLVDL